MSGKTILNVESPKTQSLEAIKSLLSWKGRAADPLPSFIEMGDGEARLVLVLSNKRDAYYCVTARDCSCPAHNWHPNQRCKHQRAHFPETAQATTKLAQSIIPERRPFKPYLADEARPARKLAMPPAEA